VKTCSKSKCGETSPTISSRAFGTSRRRRAKARSSTPGRFEGVRKPKVATAKSPGAIPSAARASASGISGVPSRLSASRLK
jgi:hypothetical protein